MMKHVWRFAAAVAVGCLFLAVHREAAAEAPARVRAYFLREQGNASPALSLDVADTLERRTRGLMFQKTLAHKRGMLFLFEDETPRSFWMKDTYVPLDMVFVNSSCRIVHIIEQAEPHTTASQACPFPNKYVVEVLGGTARKLGAKEGGLLAFVARGADGPITCPPPAISADHT